MGARPQRLIAVALTGLLLAAARAHAQEPSGPQPVTAEQLAGAIAKLGDLDFDTRTAAARTIRRTAGSQAVPALLKAVAEHTDGYVRYRALVLLTGFNDPRTHDAIRESLKSPNDRLRTVAYSFHEHNPDRASVDELLGALARELAEFVRPALVRALAANASEPRVQQALVREAGRGEDFFRSAVIEALGDYQAQYAVDILAGIAKLDGPLQDDAALALGKIGDKRALETLASLQRTAPRAGQPYVAAAICLLGVNCSSHEGFLIETMKFADQNAGFQELMRGAAAGLDALARQGRRSAAQALFALGIPSRDPTRAPIALALASVALRNTPLMLAELSEHPAQAGAIALLAEGFDMLEEDLAKERFFAFIRRTYWASAEGSPARALMQRLIAEMNF
jgi:HEAT repeat protein